MLRHEPVKKRPAYVRGLVMSPQNNGSIVNISSTYGHTGALWGFRLCREQARHGGTDEIGGAGRQPGRAYG